MNSFINRGLRSLAVALALLLPAAALAQTVVQLPVYTQNNPGSVVDLGNGPIEIKLLSGNAQIWTSQSSGTSGNNTSSSATVTITGAAPTTPPCVGCIISGTGITSGTTVSAITGTSITLSAAMSIATATTLSWGAACPSSVPTSGVALVQAGVGGDLPLYTQARICTAGQYAAGATLLPFAIGAH